MNKMKEVAELLGVQLGEEFKIKGVKEYTYKFTENSLKCFTRGGSFYSVPDTLLELIVGNAEIEKSILNKEEKEYLEYVLRPFKDKVGDITKFKHTYKKDYEYIRLYMPNDNYVVFPKFEMDSMYKGMEINKHYTLKELGLFDE